MKAARKRSPSPSRSSASLRALLSVIKGIDEDDPLPEICLTRDGKTAGTVISWKHCTLEGCSGRCIGVRWPDGKLTWPCLKGVKWLSKKKVRIL